MELENAMAIRRSPLLEHPAQREANSSAWPDALTLTALVTLCRNSWLRVLRAGTPSMEMTKCQISIAVAFLALPPQRLRRASWVFSPFPGG